MTLTTSPIRVLYNNIRQQKFKLRFIATCVLSDDFETEISFLLLMTVVLRLGPVVQLVATFVIYPVRHASLGDVIPCQRRRLVRFASLHAVEGLSLLEKKQGTFTEVPWGVLKRDRFLLL